MDSLAKGQAERTNPDVEGRLCVSDAGQYKQDLEPYGFFNSYGHSYGRIDGSCGR